MPSSDESRRCGLRLGTRYSATSVSPSLAPTGCRYIPALSLHPRDNSEEPARAPPAPRREVLRPVHRRRRAGRSKPPRLLAGAAQGRRPTAATLSGRIDQAAGARGRPGHPRGGDPARPHLHHAARPGGHPRAGLPAGRRDRPDRRHRPPGSRSSRPATRPQGAILLAEVIARATEQLLVAVKRPRARQGTARCSRPASQVKRLEEEGDALYHEWLGRLFEGEPGSADW